MEEIKVGEYVRTKQGYIGKKIACANERAWIVIESNFLLGGMPVNESEITKHSSNIIDLIEAGDYVNGYRVTGIMCGYIYLDNYADLETKIVKTLTDIIK